MHLGKRNVASSLISWWLYAKSPPLNPPGTQLLNLKTAGTRSQMLAYRPRIGFRRRRTSAGL